MSWLERVGLQEPPWIYFNGKIRPWNEGVFHVSTEAVNRGLNVFEGVKGYWQGKRFGLLQLKEHYQRLQRSAKLLSIPFEHSYEEFETACHSLVFVLYDEDHDMYLKPTLYVTEGHWGLNTKSDLIITGYKQKQFPLVESISLGVSTWQRSTDVSLPYRAKASSNYQVCRLSQIEGRSRGYPDMILLNQTGRVAEATTACLLMIRNEEVITPPSYEGALESITVDIIESICKSLKIPFIRRPIDRTELYISDGICLAGTLAELVPVNKIDEYEIKISPIFDKIRTNFWSVMRGQKNLKSINFSYLKEKE